MERQEYERIVHQYSDMVTRIAIVNVKNSDDAKDCYKQCFENEEHLKAWLIKVTINECKDYQKQFWKRVIDIDEVVICKNDEILILLPVITKLSSKYRNILYLYYYEGLLVLKFMFVLILKMEF